MQDFCKMACKLIKRRRVIGRAANRWWDDELSGRKREVERMRRQYQGSREGVNEGVMKREYYAKRKKLMRAIRPLE